MASSGSTPGAMLLAHVLASICYGNDPRHVIRNSDHLEFGTVSIGLSAQLLHHLNKPLIIPRNLHPRLIEARLQRTSRRSPIGPQIRLLQGIRLSQLTQAQERLVAHAEPIITFIDVDL